jgi:hypothetical protein
VQRIDNNGVEPGKDGRVGPDAQSQRKDRSDGEDWALSKLPKSELQVLGKRIHMRVNTLSTSSCFTIILWRSFPGRA